MAWASKAGHAYTDANAPVEFFQCQRCFQWWNGDKKINQKEWRGPRLMALGLYVCPPCADTPFIFNRPLLIPPDPVPVANPRPPQANTGPAGWSMGGGWSQGGWSVGTNYVAPAVPTEYAPPQNSTVSVDE